MAWFGHLLSVVLGFFFCQMEENSVEIGFYTVIFPNKVLWFLEFLNNTLNNFKNFQFFSIWIDKMICQTKHFDVHYCKNIGLYMYPEYLNAC